MRTGVSSPRHRDIETHHIERTDRCVIDRSNVLLVPLILFAGSAQAGQIGTTSRMPPRPIHPPQSFHRAVERGTRTDSGEPGASYWQQRVNYAIAASLNTKSARIRGRETVTYFNNSPDTLNRILFHLAQNVYAAGATRNRSVPITGGVTLGSVKVAGQPVVTSLYNESSRYYVEPTLLVVPLPTPLTPHTSTAVELEWAYTVPPAPTFRSANLDNDVFAVAQWYPRVAVYDDIYGWDTTPYLGDGEFYLEYGDFDVSLTVPAGWLIAATGVLVNSDDVLSAGVRRKLDMAERSSEVVHVVTPGDVGAATLGSPGDELTWHFTAHDVRDFAWSTSRNYVWDVASGDGGVVSHDGGVDGSQTRVDGRRFRQLLG